MADQTTREKLLNDVAYAVGRLPRSLLIELQRARAVDRDGATARAAEAIVAHLERSRWLLERPPPREPRAPEGMLTDRGSHHGRERFLAERAAREQG